jgi:hypothetical protein
MPFEHCKVDATSPPASSLFESARFAHVAGAPDDGARKHFVDGLAPEEPGAASLQPTARLGDWHLLCTVFAPS